MKTMRLLSTTVLAGLAVVWLTGCTTVGETGRRQLMLISGEQEMQLGLSSFEKLKQEVPVSKNAAANAQLQKVGARIAKVAELPGAKWEFVLFESKEANAFCLPGGKVGVYTGILPITLNEAGLATVIGHEVAHAYAHHGAERMSHAMVAQFGGEALSAALSSSDPKTQATWQSLYGMGAQVGVLLPFSRKQESEADHVGLLYMARAGYDPEEAIKFWQRFSAYSQKAGGGGSPWFLRTHPVDKKRIQNLQALMPEAKAQYRPGR